MKKIITLSGLVLLVVAFMSSCDKKKLTIDKSGTFTLSVPFTRTTDTTFAFSKSEYKIWDENPDYAAYKDKRGKIEDFTVESMTIQISDLSGSGNVRFVGGFNFDTDLGTAYGLDAKYASVLNASDSTLTQANGPSLDDFTTAMSFNDFLLKISQKTDWTAELNNNGTKCDYKNGTGDETCVTSMYASFAKDILSLNSVNFASTARIQKDNTLVGGNIIIKINFKGTFPVL